MKAFIETIEKEFTLHANAKIAAERKAYLRNQFEFYGIKTTERREIQKPFLIKSFLPDKRELGDLAKILWLKPQREYQYFTQELVFNYAKQMEKNDIELFEFMVTHKSWWDTVDFIANHLMGAYFKKFPDQKVKYVQKWLKSENIWLQRSALLFQLKYKNQLDTKLLSTTILALADSKEFFIAKAIGWILREYSRTNSEWVIDFVHETSLQALSRKEALRLIK